MNVFFIGWLIVIFLTILWLPACGVAVRLRNMDVLSPFSGLWLILPLQLMAAAGAIFLSAEAGWPHPAGFALGITVAASVLGAAALWWWRRPAF